MHGWPASSSQTQIHTALMTLLSTYKDSNDSSILDVYAAPVPQH
jgi:hypothetical protein